MKATEEELVNIPDIGDIVAKSIVDFFTDNINIDIVQNLLNVGVTPVFESTLTSDLFDGETFVITGTLENMSRKAAGELIQNNGGKVSGSVSSKTSYILAGENAGSKLTKARNLGVEVIDLETLQRMVEDGNR